MRESKRWLQQLAVRVQKPLVIRNHKRRAGWFQARAAWPKVEPSLAVLERAIQHADGMKPFAPQATKKAPWTAVGPTNVGGRVTAMVVHPADPEHLWIGAANGGVWSSADAGKTWKPLWSHEHTLAIGALAMDPKNPNVLYAGTGEANSSADSYPGVGIYRSSNGGKSWTLWADRRKAAIPARIGVLVVDPKDPNTLWLGGVAYSPQDPQGLYRSADGGRTWKQVKVGTLEECWCRSIVLDPQDPNTIYVGLTARSVFDGIYRSRDRGNTWQRLTAGLPPGDQIDRIALAVAPSDPRVLYAQISTMRSGHLGLFKSAAAGDHWIDVSGDAFRHERQMQYNNVVVVHPEEPDWVLAGGVDLHLSRNGGASWEQVTDWRADRGEKNYAHADQHALVMPTSAPGRVYAGNDGGVDVSVDGGRTWANRSDGLAITMFYDLDVAQTDARFFGGGCQDNGTNVTTDGRSDTFFDLTGGDGGWMVIDPADASHVIASIYNGQIFRWAGGGRPQDISLPLPPTEADVWMVFIVMDPADSNTLITGAKRVWRTKDAGKTWMAVSDVLDGSFVSAVVIAPSDSRIVYAGTEKGAIFRSKDGGDTWSENLAGNDVPEFVITRLAIHPTNPQTVYATVANVGHSHVYRSMDGGDLWEDVDRRRLPDISHNSLVIHPEDPSRIFVANDVGVFATADAGKTWQNLSFNLPRTPVTDVVLHRQSQTLLAATYGRGIYSLSLGAGALPRVAAVRRAKRRR